MFALKIPRRFSHSRRFARSRGGFLRAPPMAIV
jgi:hypothetical protein